LRRLSDVSGTPENIARRSSVNVREPQRLVQSSRRGSGVAGPRQRAGVDGSFGIVESLGWRKSGVTACRSAA